MIFRLFFITVHVLLHILVISWAFRVWLVALWQRLIQWYLVDVTRLHVINHKRRRGIHLTRNGEEEYCSFHLTTLDIQECEQEYLIWTKKHLMPMFVHTMVDNCISAPQHATPMRWGEQKISSSVSIIFSSSLSRRFSSAIHQATDGSHWQTSAWQTNDYGLASKSHANYWIPFVSSFMNTPNNRSTETPKRKRTGNKY